MKKERGDRDMPIGELKAVKDFLPPPDKLGMPERTVKITLLLNQSSVKFFKTQAKKYHAKYQKMIRSLLDQYVERYTH